MRSLWKGQIIDPNIKRLKWDIKARILNDIPLNVIKKTKINKNYRTNNRNHMILRKDIGLRILIHNGKILRQKKITKLMRNKKIGEFVSTRKI